jgi:hypothetical protein
LRITLLSSTQAEAEARLKAEQSKKKGSKGLCMLIITLTTFGVILIISYLAVLSGKELFNFNAALFVDDNAAIDAVEENRLNAATKLVAEEEEARAVFEAERARAEQRRLEEARRLEEEERDRMLDERRSLAKLAKDTFLLGSIVINQIVFDSEEYEDLIPFLDEKEAYESREELYDDSEDEADGVEVKEVDDDEQRDIDTLPEDITEKLRLKEFHCEVES